MCIPSTRHLPHGAQTQTRLEERDGAEHDTHRTRGDAQRTTAAEDLRLERAGGAAGRGRAGLRGLDARGRLRACGRGRLGGRGGGAGRGGGGDGGADARVAGGGGGGACGGAGGGAHCAERGEG